MSGEGQGRRRQAGGQRATGGRQRRRQLNVAGTQQTSGHSARRYSGRDDVIHDAGRVPGRGGAGAGGVARGTESRDPGAEVRGQDERRRRPAGSRVPLPADRTSAGTAGQR